MSSVAGRASLEAVRPYGDHLDDGLVQMSFTLPVDHGPLAREAALALVTQMGLVRPEIVHIETLRERRYGRATPEADPTSAMDAAWAMLEAGEVRPKEFLELCWEALAEA